MKAVALALAVFAAGAGTMLGIAYVLDVLTRP